MLRFFQAKDVQITQCSSEQAQAKPDWDNLVFGKHFSDHMLTIEWSEEHGWASPRISPLQNFSIHPAAKVFHYATEVKDCFLFSDLISIVYSKKYGIFPV